MTDCIVIGAGPAGMTAAYAASARGKSVVLLEKNEKTGKKIYLTGKGRCNLTNNCDEKTFLDNIFVNRSFLYSAVYAFPPERVMDLLGEGGLKMKTERGGRVFPVSDKASDVTRSLNRLMIEAGVEIRLNSEVSEILFENGSVRGVKLKGGETLESENVILATGGESYPSTGSDGFGYRLAESAGHTIDATRPALVSMLSDEKWIEGLAGLSLKNVGVTLYEKGRKPVSEFGEMLFTHRGVSGPVILTLSCLVEEFMDTYITIDLKPALDEQTLDSRILRDFGEFSNKDFKNSLDELLPGRLRDKIVALAGIRPDKKVNQITAEERKRLVTLLKQLRLNINGTGGFDEAIVTRGGINVKEIDPKRMASKLVKGLYFAGEIINAHGYTGGFNMQQAFSTGYLAGSSV
ncbi:MAG: NAD(P)/FAD-dependent oxidoreductase [Eubacteriaceae bacterium]|nr:NAD(P)/FAD-dependent oxidoreductase [Eubacteriaceae bacterium]